MVVGERVCCSEIRHTSLHPTHKTARIPGSGSAIIWKACGETAEGAEGESEDAAGSSMRVISLTKDVPQNAAEYLLTYYRTRRRCRCQHFSGSEGERKDYRMGE